MYNRLFVGLIEWDGGNLMLQACLGRDYGSGEPTLHAEGLASPGKVGERAWKTAVRQGR